MRRVLRRIRLASRIALGREPRLALDLHVPGAVHVGSEYGGWTLLPDLLDTSSLVYSFGVGEDISFDLELIALRGVTVHAFDPTPRSIEWVAGRETPSSFRMHATGIATFDGEARFELPSNEEHVSLRIVKGSGNDERTLSLPVARLHTLLERLDHPEPDLLKLDIEGAEYGVLEDLVRSGIRPRQLLVEFHHHLDGFDASDTVKAVEGLRGVGYRVVSVSPNNHEVSFLHDGAGASPGHTPG